MSRSVCWFIVFVAFGAGLGADRTSAQTPQITSVIPAVVFAELKDPGKGTYTLTLRGTGFDKSRPAKNVLVIDNGAPLIICPPKSTDPNCKGDLTVTLVNNDLIYQGIPSSLAGAQKIWVQVGDAVSEPRRVVFSSVGWAVPYYVTAGIVVALGLLVVVVVSNGYPRRLANGGSVSLARAMLVDAQTSTYSLSKLQLYVWGTAVLIGYIYLCVAQSLVQGVWVLADVPGNLAGIILIAAGTSVVSTGISTAGGGKGSGDFVPMLSDLITSGGVVAPERLQQLLWTVLGGLAFLFFTFGISPASIETLPDIPNGFLQLMGVSAAGYLGGKVARGSGPKITGATGSIAAGQPLTLKIDGTALATRGAAYYLADITTNAAAAETQVAAEIVQAASQIDIAGIATHLELSVPDKTPITFAPGQKLRFIMMTASGEKATWELVVA